MLPAEEERTTPEIYKKTLVTAKPSPHLNLGTLVSKAGKGDHGWDPSIWGLAETSSYQELFLQVNQSFFLKTFSSLPLPGISGLKPQLYPFLTV